MPVGMTELRDRVDAYCLMQVKLVGQALDGKTLSQYSKQTKVNQTKPSQCQDGRRQSKKGSM